MSDDELIEAFEAITLPASDFDHACHVRVAWCYLRRHRLGEALDRFSRALQAFAAAHGAAGKYHETMTVAYMLVIADRLREDAGGGWPEFAARHPDLLERRPSVLARYYTDGTLESDAARRRFVMPDRVVEEGARNQGTGGAGTP